jgi:hypothetical protein
MNRHSNHAFVNHVIVYTLVMICFTGSIGLGTVWMRHQISLTANATKLVEARIAEMERRVNENTAVMESLQDPAALREANAKWHLGLVQPSPEQIVRIADDPVRKLATKRDRALYTDSAPPATVSLRLAGLAP